MCYVMDTTAKGNRRQCTDVLDLHTGLSLHSWAISNGKHFLLNVGCQIMLLDCSKIKNLIWQLTMGKKRVGAAAGASTSSLVRVCRAVSVASCWAERLNRSSRYCRLSSAPVLPSKKPPGTDHKHMTLPCNCYPCSVTTLVLLFKHSQHLQ